MAKAIVLRLPPGDALTTDDRIAASVSSVHMFVNRMQESVHDYAVRIGNSLLSIQSECKKDGRKFGDVFAKDAEEARAIRANQDRAKVPMVWGTGNMMMSIAQNPVLVDSKHACNLPADWTALYKLSRIEPKALAKLIDDGTVNSSMSRNAIQRLLPKAVKKRSVKKNSKETMQAQAARLAKGLSTDELIELIDYLEIALEKRGGRHT